MCSEIRRTQPIFRKLTSSAGIWGAVAEIYNLGVVVRQSAGGKGEEREGECKKDGQKLHF